VAFYPDPRIFENRLVVVLAGASHRVFRSTLQGLNQSIVDLSPLFETTYSTSHEIPNDES
jgi:arginine deiminase